MLESVSVASLGAPRGSPLGKRRELGVGRGACRRAGAWPGLVSLVPSRLSAFWKRVTFHT